MNSANTDSIDRDWRAGPDRQAAKAFWRTGCQVKEDEPPNAAAARGSAAECADDAVKLLKEGESELAMHLLESALAYTRKSLWLA